MTILANLIRGIHILLVIFILFAPFFGNPYMLSMHLLIVPFIMAHWLTNQSVCALTEIEKLLRGKTCDEETFIGQIVGPVYKFKTYKEESMFVWTLLAALWFITFIKLHRTKFKFLRDEKARLLALWRSI